MGRNKETEPLCGEDVICKRIITSFDALVTEEALRRRSLGMPPPEEFEFEEDEIISMYSQLYLPEHSWDTTSLPRMLVDSAFNILVGSGTLQQTTILDINLETGEEEGDLFKKYKRPQSE